MKVIETQSFQKIAQAAEGDPSTWTPGMTGTYHFDRISKYPATLIGKEVINLPAGPTEVWALTDDSTRRKMYLYDVKKFVPDQPS